MILLNRPYTRFLLQLWLILAHCLLPILFGLYGHSSYAADAAPSLKAYQLKAVFLLNYGKYIRWPNSAFHNDQSSFLICVLGESPFRGALDAAVEGERIRGREVEVRYSFLAENLGTCHALFIARSERPRLSFLLERLKGLPVLTVSDVEDFIEQGGQIQFYTDEDNIRFALHLGRLRELGLEPNANLLRISRVVKGGEQ